MGGVVIGGGWWCWSGEWRGVYLWFARDWLGHDAETRFRRDFGRVFGAMFLGSVDRHGNLAE
jgi:hypothetical protein